MLLCCIIPSSSGKTNASSRRSKKDFWRRCRGSLRKCQHTKYPSHTLISRITLFAICLSFSSPPNSPLTFYSPSLSLSSLSVCLFTPLAFCLLVCQIACLSRWLNQDSVIFTLKGQRRSKTTLGNLWFCNLSIIISLETSLKNKKVL